CPSRPGAGLQAPPAGTALAPSIGCHRSTTLDEQDVRLVTEVGTDVKQKITITETKAAVLVLDILEQIGNTCWFGSRLRRQWIRTHEARGCASSMRNARIRWCCRGSSWPMTTRSWTSSSAMSANSTCTSRTITRPSCATASRTRSMPRFSARASSRRTIVCGLRGEPVYNCRRVCYQGYLRRAAGAVARQFVTLIDLSLRDLGAMQRGQRAARRSLSVGDRIG